MNRRFQKLSSMFKFSFLVLSIQSLLHCQTRKREQDIDLGDKPIAAESSAAAVFELRHGSFIAVPNSLLADAASYVSHYLEENAAQEGTSKTSISPAPGGQIETDPGDSDITFCTKDVTLKTSSSQPTTLLLTIKTCGLKMAVRNARSALRFDGALNDKPVVLSIGNMTLNDVGAERDISVEASISFNRRGELFVSDMKMLAGFDQLGDASNYNLDLNYTGFEENAGVVGDKVHDIREELLKSILVGVRKYAEAALVNITKKAIETGSSKVNKLRIATGGLNFRVLVDIFEMVGSAQLRNLVGNDKGLGVSAHLLSSIGLKPGNTKIPCTSSYSSAPSAEPILDAAASKNLIFANFGEGNAANAGVSSLVSAFYFSEAYINHQIWQLFGDKGYCEITVPLAGGIKGQISFNYDQPIKMTIDPPDARFKSADGAMLTTTFPAVQITLSKEVVNFLDKKSLVLKTDIDGAISFSIPNFRHAVLFKIEKGNSTLVPHPFIESAYEEGFREGENAKIDMLSAYIKGWRPPAAFADAATNQMHAIFNSALDFLYKNTVRPDSFTITTNTGALVRIDKLTAENHMLKASIFIDDKNKLVPTPGSASLTNQPNLASNSDVDLSQIQISKLVHALDQSAQEMLSEVQAATFFPDDWTCSVVSAEPLGLPIDLKKLTYVSYAYCGLGQAPEVELRWQFDGPVGPIASENRLINYIRLRHLRPSMVKVGLSIDPEDAPGDKQREVLLTKFSARTTWDLPHYFLSTEGFCLFSSADCSKTPDAARIFDVEILKK